MALRDLQRFGREEKREKKSESLVVVVGWWCQSLIVCCLFQARAHVQEEHAHVHGPKSILFHHFLFFCALLTCYAIFTHALP